MNIKILIGDLISFEFILPIIGIIISIVVYLFLKRLKAFIIIILTLHIIIAILKFIIYFSGLEYIKRYLSEINPSGIYKVIDKTILITNINSSIYIIFVLITLILTALFINKKFSLQGSIKSVHHAINK